MIGGPGHRARFPSPPPVMHPLTLKFGASCLVAVLLVTPSAAQRIDRSPAVAARALPPDSILARGLTFRSIGPAVMGGRISDIAVAENPASARGGRLGTVIYVGAATGGVWKSVNGGGDLGPSFVFLGHRGGGGG